MSVINHIKSDYGQNFEGQNREKERESKRDSPSFCIKKF